MLQHASFIFKKERNILYITMSLHIIITHNAHQHVH